MVDTEVGAMCLPVSERSSSSLLCHGRLTNEVRESKLVAALAGLCDTMIDIGAHQGWYMRLLARNAPRGRVFAFEPDPRTFQYLSRNTDGLSNVVPFNVGIGAKDGSATLWRGSASNLNSMVRRVGKPLEIPMWTLDGFCLAQGLDRVDFVKCDVEGGEVSVLQGGRRVLSGPNPPIWMIEVSEQFLSEAGSSAEDLIRELECGRPGGSVFTQDERGNPIEITKLSQRVIGNNVFFVPQQRLSMFRQAADSVLRQS